MILLFKKNIYKNNHNASSLLTKKSVNMYGFNNKMSKLQYIVLIQIVSTYLK